MKNDFMNSEVHLMISDSFMLLEYFSMGPI